MSKERLEEIENKLLQATNEDDEDVVYASICAEAVLEDLQWTVGYAKEQAERVQELEELIAAYHTELSIKDNANKRTKKKNKRYREALDKIKRELYKMSVWGKEEISMLDIIHDLEGEE